MHNDLPETNDWDSWLGQSAVTKASDKSCVNKLFWNVMVGITWSKVIFLIFLWFLRLLHLQQEAGFGHRASFGTNSPSRQAPALQAVQAVKAHHGTPPRGPTGPTEAYLFNAVGIFGLGNSGPLGYQSLGHQICTTDRSCYNARVSNISTLLGFFPFGKQRNAPHSMTLWRLSPWIELRVVLAKVSMQLFFSQHFLAALLILPERRKNLLHKDLDGLGTQISNRDPPTNSSKPNLWLPDPCPPARTSDAMPDPWDSKTAWHSKRSSAEICRNDLFGPQSFLPIFCLFRSSASSVTRMWRTQIWKVATQSPGLHLVS